MKGDTPEIKIEMKKVLNRVPTVFKSSTLMSVSIFQTFFLRITAMQTRGTQPGATSCRKMNALIGLGPMMQLSRKTSKSKLRSDTKFRISPRGPLHSMESWRKTPSVWIPPKSSAIITTLNIAELDCNASFRFTATVQTATPRKTAPMATRKGKVPVAPSHSRHSPPEEYEPPSQTPQEGSRGSRRTAQEAVPPPGQWLSGKQWNTRSGSAASDM
mmetsp:Transcript_39656/g.113573  ORF Transcript_39656/g.113573 Transcript_39656/m.113573 type:complete len:215 (+) Transcript_39656:1116-1760(+)